MHYKFKPHTVLMMIGPTGCGKSSMAQHIGHSFKTKYGADLKGHIVSSDQNRSALLNQGFEINKRDPRMQQVSKQAFDILFTELKNLMSYPVSSELIIVDTTGMAKEFRDQVAAMVKAHHYHLDAMLFDYRDQKEFYRYLDENENSKKIVAQAVKRFRTKTLPDVKSKDFNQLVRLKDRVDSISIEMENHEFYKSHFLDPEKTYVAIGDVHGCADELKQLISQLHDDDVPILIGDIVDKGPKIAETIQYVFSNLDRFKIVLGNHENFLWKVLTGVVDKHNVDPTILETYFDSLPLLEADATLKHMFLEICEASKGFLIHPRYILTHAPCDQKYLGKIDAISLREQRNMQRRDDISTLEQLQFLYEQAEVNYPYHVFGHIAFEETFRFKNKVGIDTGCVEGNKLTFVHLLDRPFIKDVKSSLEKTKELIVVPKREVEFNFNDLTPRDRKRLWSCANNKINFISGTVSPADKLGVELESLKAGLDYYKDLGVDRVMMQTKYMGSRCQVYLDLENLENSYAVSRNGYKIRGDLSHVYSSLESKFTEEAKMNVNMVIFDGELLPWNNPDLGAGLIAKHFYPVEHALNFEMQHLIESNFHAMYQDLKQKKDSSDFAKDSTSMKKADLSNKYKGQYESFKCVDEFDFINPDQEIGMIQTYNEQMWLYASEGEVHYKPFNILKVIYTDGSEKIPDDNFTSYQTVSTDPICYVDLTADDYYKQAVDHWNALVGDGTIEGVVIKPRHSLGDYAPFIKVRNHNYLHIVYGHDFTHPAKYQKLLKRKSIKRKMKTSIREFALGMEMLKVPYSEINPDNREYKTMVAKMIGLETTEKELDPRL